MKRVFIVFLILLGCNFVFAEENPHNLVQDGDQIIYQPSESNWVSESSAEDKIVYVKKLYDRDGAYSQYNNEDGSFAFILNTGCEILKDGKLIIVYNNFLKF